MAGAERAETATGGAKSDTTGDPGGGASTGATTSRRGSAGSTADSAGTTPGTVSAGASAGASSGATPPGAAAGASGVCELPDCCVPLHFEPDSSRLYLVEDRLVPYLVASSSDRSHEGSAFDAEIAVDGGRSQTCSSSGYLPDLGRLEGECAPAVVSGFECGQVVAVTVRLRYAEYDPTTGEARCEGTDYGPSVTWQATVQCPTCPTLPGNGEACDHPSISGCGYSTGGNIHCAPISFLACSCATGWNSGLRTWQCPVC